MTCLGKFHIKIHISVLFYSCKSENIAAIGLSLPVAVMEPGSGVLYRHSASLMGVFYLYLICVKSLCFLVQAMLCIFQDVVVGFWEKRESMPLHVLCVNE